MSQPIPVFVELCAGLASVSGVLQHGSTWKPPISRMGRKTGYAGAILRVMGLRPRQGARGYVWAEADGDVAALLAAYTQPDVMREIAETIRSWIPCPYGPHAPDPSCSRCKGTGRWDARDLWETLRREPRRGLWEGGGSVGEVAGFCNEAAWTKGNQRGGMYMGPDRPSARHDPGWVASITASGLAARFEAGGTWPPVFLAQSASVGVGEVAGWLVACKGSYQEKGIDYGIGWPEDRAATATQGTHEGAVTWCARHTDRLVRSWPPVALTPSAHLDPPALPVGTVVYMDPPYAGTTGYKHDLGRDEVVAIAEKWRAAGARVHISEAEPIPIPGWHHVEITGERKGQARTFGATREFLTCSHPPAWMPAVQHSLFGRAA